MKFTLEIECDNAVFFDDEGEPDPNYEVARILRQTAKEVENGAETLRLYDGNGNRVGLARFEED